MPLIRRAAALLALLAAAACDGELPPVEPSECGPSEAVVARVIDGDTVELEGGQRVRYLLIDTPESTQGKDDCFGQEAAEANRGLVEGQRVALAYDKECRDRYDRLLAYVHTPDGEVGRILVRGGHACVYVIHPPGQEREAEYRALEREAQLLRAGLWGACPVPTCQH